MRCRKHLLILAILSLLIISACTKAECKKDLDCTGKPKNAFTAACVEKKCEYTKIPGVCGNGDCESDKEGKCTCATDCGKCEGIVKGTKYIAMQCVNKECVEDVDAKQIKPTFSSMEASSLNDKFKIDLKYNTPFNLKRDTFDVTLTLNSQGAQNSDEHIQRLEITATTKDKRTITLATHEVDKYLFASTSSIDENVILDFPTVDSEGELTNLIIKVYYDYLNLQAGKKQQKQGQFQVTSRIPLIFVMPTMKYQCPQDPKACDDKNPGTRDYCDPATIFCRHEPIPNACGNFKCDTNENKCSCEKDCGPCSGSAGNYLDFGCKMNKCITVLRNGVQIQQSSLFDDRGLGPVQLNNNYKFNNPLNIKKDKFNFDFKIYRKDPSIESVTIETIRFLEGQQQLAELEVNKDLSESPLTISMSIPSITSPEEDHNIALAVWYKYVQSGAEKRGNFQKPLGKITLIAPE